MAQHRMSRRAQKMEWEMRVISQPLLSAEERADARRARTAPVPANPLKVEFLHQIDGENVYTVYTDNLSEFEMYFAGAGTDRDMMLAHLAGREGLQ